MKRYMGLALVAIVTVVCVVAAAGCGSDVGTAKDYMKQADDAYNAAELKGQELNQEMTDDLTALMSGDPAQVQKVAADLPTLEKNIAGYKSLLQTANERYSKIDALEGVTDYITYKTMMVQVIMMDNEIINTATDLLKAISPVLQQAAAGQPVDMAAVQGTVTKAVTDITSEVERRDKLVKDARAFQSENNL